ncbi:MAG: serine hydrolase, partial [Victivallales bacterium]|nr:serine hydrolase [Victivallales bacterium]
MTYHRFETATPEEVGISSANIRKFVEVLEENELQTHNILLLRHGKLIFEQYWAPFHREHKHRMYSVTKSFVSLAIGFLEQEGRISLDDPICKYFPAESENAHPFRKAQTIRHMLMMATSYGSNYWFGDRPEDRVQNYFSFRPEGIHPAGTVWSYDSSGSFILGALVERVTGMKLFHYLKDRLFDKIGVGEVDWLDCPGGHTWSDSALLARPIDLLRVALFCMNKGEGILNEAYVTAATAKQFDTHTGGHCLYESQGYGYQFWRSVDNSFFFNGMGGQFAVCVPDKDLIMVINADNQGITDATSVVLEHFFNLISRPAGEPLPPAETPLCPDGMELHHTKGEKHTSLESKVSGAVYRLDENPMGMTELSVTFGEDEGVLRWVNAQGEK